MKPMMQVARGDCALAALHMVLGEPYETVSRVARELVDRPHDRGLYTSEIKKVAKKLGHRLTTVRISRGHDFEEVTGILLVRFKDDSEHAVVLFNGTLYDPSTGMLYLPEAYFATEEARPINLLIP